MKSTLFLLPFIALMAVGASVNAQDQKKSETQAKEQLTDRYQQQKKTVQTAFKRDMDALNDQKNLTPEQKQLQRKQIIATYQQQKKANQEIFHDNKEALKTSIKTGKEAEKAGEQPEKRMKEKEVAKARNLKHHENKPHIAPKVKKA